MTLKSIRARLYTFLPAAVLFTLDQGLKALAHSMSRGSQIRFLPCLRFTLSHNPGIAFGLLSECDHVLLALIQFVITMGCGILIYHAWHDLRTLSFQHHLIFSAFLASILSNAWDRTLHNGSIVDYLEFFWAKHPGLNFNLADVLLVVVFLSVSVGIVKKLLTADNRARL